MYWSIKLNWEKPTHQCRLEKQILGSGDREDTFQEALIQSPDKVGATENKGRNILKMGYSACPGTCPALSYFQLQASTP